MISADINDTKPIYASNRKLNPKLTRRQYVRPPSDDPPENGDPVEPINESLVRAIKFSPPNKSSIEKNSQSNKDDTESNSSKSNMLVHDGKWINKEYDSSGKSRPFTGIWTCCGATDHLESLYCPSLESKAKFALILKEETEKKEKEKKYYEFTIQFRQNLQERENKEREQREKERGTEAFDAEKTAATTTHDSCNAPMLVSWIYKHINDEFTVTSGLSLMLENVHNGESCLNMVQYDCVRCVMRAHSVYVGNAEVQLLCVSILRMLLDCNLTRDVVIGDGKTLKMLFSTAHCYMDSLAHVEQCVQGILQCARAEKCREDIMNLHIINYEILFCRKYWRVPAILRSILKLFNWVTNTPQRMVAVYNAGAVRTTLKIMERHITNPDVLAPAMHFLTRAAASHPPASDYLLRKRAIPTVIGAMKALFSSEQLQLEALKMLQALSQHEDGWNQISEVKGGWQIICQGTAVGDALVHDLAGDFHNPGWCIGDTPHLPELERLKLIAAKAAASKSASTNTTWTSITLRLFMGQNTKVQKLAINNEFHDAYFNLVRSLELLPIAGEEREQWYKRIIEYEKLNELTLEEMVNTILELRRKEEKQAALAAKGLEDDSEYVKPVYVMGKRITTRMLEENDQNAAMELEGIV